VPQNCLCQLLREEEIKWYQRSKARNLLEGDSNTKYFHLLANGRHRIRGGQKKSVETMLLKKHITTYCKGLFGPPQEDSFRLDETQRDDIPQVTPEENIILVEEFT
jgi:hypothetical protein